MRRVALERLDRLLHGGRHQHDGAEVLEAVLEPEPRVGVVLHHEDAEVVEPRPLRPRPNHGRGDAIGRVHGQGHRERRAQALSGALGADRPAVHLDEVPHDRQAEAETGDRPPCVGLTEPVEDVRQDRRRNALARVAHLDDDVGPHALQREVHVSLVGRELDRVGQEVPEDLLQAVGIREDGPHRRVDAHAERDRLGGRRGPHGIDGGRRHRRRLDRACRDPQLAGDDARDVEQVLDELGERGRAALDRLQRPLLALLVEAPAAQPPDPAHERVERRAQLVREGGQELVLGASGRLGVGARGLLLAHEVFARPRQGLGALARVARARVQRGGEERDDGEGARAHDRGGAEHEERREEDRFGDDQRQDGGDEARPEPAVPAGEDDGGQEERRHGALEGRAEREGHDGGPGHGGDGDRVGAQAGAHGLSSPARPARASAGC